MKNDLENDVVVVRHDNNLNEKKIFVDIRKSGVHIKASGKDG